MSSRWIAFPALAIALSLGAGAAMANETSLAAGNPTAQRMEVTRGGMGAGPRFQPLGSPLRNAMPVSERELPALEESLALGNNAPSSDAFGRTYDGHPLARHMAEAEGRQRQLEAARAQARNPGS
ncbi:hypothetical protein [Roseomonas sp. USHLN139]|uniref:hypothetical protein n=1 Tax=Roseomonas sp. USHLN139 TaxID=3081298 RepID=UPI003B019A8A